MALLEGLVILTIIVTACFVGYHAWQEWLHEDDAEGHAYDPGYEAASAGTSAARWHGEAAYAVKRLA